MRIGTWCCRGLLVLLVGCKSQSPPVPVVTPSPAYFPSEAGVIQMDLDSSWTPGRLMQTASSGKVSRTWFKPKLGTLTVAQVSARPLGQQWSKLKKSLAQGGPDFQHQMDLLYQEHLLFRDETVRGWLTRRNQASLRKWLDEQEQAEQSQDPERYLAYRFRLGDFDRILRGQPQEVQLDHRRASSSLSIRQDSLHPRPGLYLAQAKHLIYWEMDSDRAPAREWLAELAGKVKVDVKVELAAEPPPLMPTPTVANPPESTSNLQESVQDYLPWVVALVMLFVVSIPARVGALSGYDEWQQKGQNPCIGAALTAARYTWKSSLWAAAALIMCLLVLAAIYNNQAGMMSLFMAAILFSFMFAVGAFFCSLCAALMAGLGAYLGALRGRQASAWGATLGLALGILLTPGVLRGQFHDAGRRHRHASRQVGR